MINNFMDDLNKMNENSNIKIIYEKPKWRNIIFDGTN
jgi:hypothetical protein